jgi:CRISPR-associated endonuclease/helicase Cas3
LHKLRLGRLSQELEVKGRVQNDVKSINHKPKLKALYCWLLSLLKSSDFLASRNFSEKAGESEGVLGALLDEPPLWDFPVDAREKLLQSLSGEIYSFQQKLADCEAPYVVLMAPCGRGKTEGALLWFLKQYELLSLDRLIFALPTQITSNAMRERLARLFGEERIGLYHGRSSLEHRELVQLNLEKQKEGEEELHPDLERELAHEENFWGEVIAKPITVTTVDHLLYTFVHGYRQADFALGNLQTAAIYKRQPSFLTRFTTMTDVCSLSFGNFLNSCGKCKSHISL